MTEVAVLGLGHMGTPIARRLADTGHRVTVWNRTARGPGSPAFASGGDVVVAGSPAEAARAADVVILMLTDAGAVEAVLFGPEGAVSGLRPGAVIVDMSTIGPDGVRAVASRLPDGIEMVDAPVAGSVDAASRGVLTILAGGRRSTVDAVASVLSALGTLRYCGDSGRGAALKVVLNAALVTSFAALGAVLAVAEALDVPLPDALEALGSGALGGAVQRATAGGGHFRIALAAKDLDLATRAMSGADAPGRDAPDLAVLLAADAVLAHAMRSGLAEADLGTLISAR